MRTRKTDVVDTVATPKNTPPVTRKSAAKTRPTPPSTVSKDEASAAENLELKRASSAEFKKPNPADGWPAIAQVETTKVSDEAIQVPQVAKAVSGTKITRKVVKKVIKKIPASARNASGRASGIETDAKAKTEETKREETLGQSIASESADIGRTTEDKSLAVTPQEPLVAGQKIGNPGNVLKNQEEKVHERQNNLFKSRENISGIKPASTKMMIMDEKQPAEAEYSEKVKEQQVKFGIQTIGILEESNDVIKLDDPSLEEDDNAKIECISDQEVHEEFGAEDFANDLSENEAEADTFDEEQVELKAASSERKSRREREIFVGGLDRDAVEADVRKVFKYAGEVVEVRMHMDPSTNKNKGFAFVQFAAKEQASYALSEMKNPVIHGKRCGTAPIEGDNTLFLGNICNTWTQEAIQKKLKDYGIQGIENIATVSDPRNEGLTRGFAFIEFSCHGEAMIAYKRLQKPDVVFGHAQRTAKVAFAEPQREPDPEIMAQVKSVFLDGLPPHWDDDCVRMKFNVFGGITKILLARNMSTAKRNDFGFVDFVTHDAAVACVESVNTNGVNDGNSKVIVRARLSNPLPKMQAIKGEICGGFRINRGRGFVRGVQPLNQVNFQYPRDYNYHGSGRVGRMNTSNPCEFNTPRSFYRSPPSGRVDRWDSTCAYQGPEPTRLYVGRDRYNATDRGYEHYESYRRSSYSEEDYNASFIGRNTNDLYPYDDDVSHGMKRPSYMMDQDSNSSELSRRRPRPDYSFPSIPNRQSRYQDQDDRGVDRSLYTQNYHDPGFGGHVYSAYRGDRPYGHGYYY